ncbi:MAG: Gfo/Idh/MocA family oxidoreductase [Verrucomicrobia bacterium]|nr:Gfo/Idh/MocA family oxidoreductase [Verrucomicrobiota bacterium]
MNNSSATPPPVRLAMLGMIPGNGHPYSWSAIVNGFDPVAMARCPYPVIPVYLGARPAGSVGIPGARVTHLWTDNPAEAPDVAAAALIPRVVARPEDVIGEVDAVVIATDDGLDHVRRARPFIEAGLPVFVDKPLATSLEELRTFLAWEKAGAKLLSSSGLRYAPELDTCLANLKSLGELRWLCGLSCKTWERYGIHLLEPLYRIVGPGIVSVRLESAPGLEIAHLVHRSGVQLTLPVIYDGGPTFGNLQLGGTAGLMPVKFTDTYTGFRRQMVSFVDFVRCGVAPYPFAETVELMVALIAGLRSRAENSRRVELAEIYAQLPS